jgi:SAM-dependent methyltransferase
MTTPRNLQPDAFAGTADAYARFRPSYPSAMLADLIAQAAPAAPSCLLDLACGPGRVALDLAGAFDSVRAVDLEPEMIEAARQAALRRGVGNISWSIGAAEDLEAEADTFDLITIGEAFHRLDQPLIARRAMVWLKPGGCLATLGGEGVLSGGEDWQIAVAEVAQRWMARVFPGGWGEARPGVIPGLEAQQAVLRRAGFMDIADHAFDEPRDWTVESIIGYLHSTSVCSRAALGDDAPAFEADIHTALGDPGETVRFHETMRWSYTLARKAA